MVRSLAAAMLCVLLLPSAWQPHDPALLTGMVPVKMADGHVLSVSPTEVTVADWMRCVEDRGCTHGVKTPPKTPSQPVTGVNWFDVNEFLAWASARSGANLRLPTQDEWRWLNRSLEKPKAPPLFTDPRLAWAANYGRESNTGGPVKPSRSFSTTPDGIADLDGNVWEWTSSCAVAGLGPADCPAYVVEGEHEAVISIFIRNPANGGCATGTPPTYVGFRLVTDE